MVYTDAAFGFDGPKWLYGIVYSDRPPALVSIYHHHDTTPIYNNYRAINVTAHETGHALTLAHAEGDADPQMSFRLMTGRGNDYESKHLSPKRLIESEVTTIKQQSRYYYVPTP